MSSNLLKENLTRNTSNQANRNYNLIECPDCGSMVSRNAFSCPHCGHPFMAKSQSNEEYYDQPESNRTPSVGNIVKRLFLTIMAIFVCGYVYFNASDIFKNTKSSTEKKTSNSYLNISQSSKSAPTANPAINDISIASVKMSENSIGIPILYIVFQNDSNKTIDRIDFNIKCYNTYGELIKPSILSDGKSYFFDTNLKPGKKSDKDQYLSLSNFTGTRSVEIAVTKYHTTNGETIEVPYNLLKYHKYTFH